MINFKPMIELTIEQSQALEQIGDTPAGLRSVEPRVEYVVLKADVFRRMEQLLENSADAEVQQQWLELSRRGMLSWMKENPY